jgi:MurNAc alpha-1-phosphate uridylyltransferase
MKAMILAAGRGQRMMPLTKNTPKPLLKIKGKTLIEYRLDELKKIDITEVIINLSYLGEKIQQHLGQNYKGINLTYSFEKEGGLETAGGIFKVLDFFEDQPFIVINADIFCDYPLANLKLKKQLAHLILVKNPEHNPKGDFNLNQEKITLEKKLTFSGIGIYNPKLFYGLEKNKKVPLYQVLKPAIEQGLITGEFFNGNWQDIGTPERLQQINNE